MGLHSVLFRNAAQAISANLVALPIIPSAMDNVSGTSWLPPFRAKLMAAAGFGATMSDFRVSTPLLLQTNQLVMRPWNASIVPITDYNICDLTKFQITFNQNENVQPVSSNSNGAATDDQWAVLHFSDGKIDYPSGTDMIIEFLSSTAAVANTWVRTTLVPVQTLPAKRFAIMGFDVVGTTGICAKLLFPGGGGNYNGMSPGTIPLPTIGVRGPYPLYQQPYGVLGYFDNQTIPNMEYFAKAADATQRVWMWVKVLN